MSRSLPASASRSSRVCWIGGWLWRASRALICAWSSSRSNSRSRYFSSSGPVRERREIAAITRATRAFISPLRFRNASNSPVPACSCSACRARASACSSASEAGWMTCSSRLSTTACSSRWPGMRPLAQSLRPFGRPPQIIFVFPFAAPDDRIAVCRSSAQPAACQAGEQITPPAAVGVIGSLAVRQVVGQRVALVHILYQVPGLLADERFAIAGNRQWPKFQDAQVNPVAEKAVVGIIRFVQPGPTADFGQCCAFGAQFPGQAAALPLVLGAGHPAVDDVRLPVATFADFQLFPPEAARWCAGNAAVLLDQFPQPALDLLR